MKIIKTTAHTMGDLYADLFVRVFGKWNTHHVPDHVWLFVDDDDSDILGFACGCEVTPVEIFLMFGGCCPEYRGPRVRGRLKQVREYLHNNYKYITTNVENTNLPMLKLYLSIGYLIHGIHYSTDNKTFVELISTKEQ